MGSINAFLFSLVLIATTFAIANYFAWRLFDKPRHALIWAVVFVLIAVQYSINMARDLLPSTEVYALLANTVSFALVICAVWGHRERLGLRTPRKLMIGVFAGLVLVNIVANYPVPREGLRMAMAPGFVFIAMTYLLYLLFKHSGRPRLPQQATAIVHFLYGLTQGSAAIVALQIGSPPDPDMVALYRMVNFLLMPSFFVALGVSVIFLLATDLSYKLNKLALSDQLTGVNNRRGFIERAEALLSRADRQGRVVTLIMCDLDHFKRINDRHGHIIGDRALARFAEILRHSVRIGDEIGRLGGEEFAICLEGMNSEDAAVIAERVRAGLAANPVSKGSKPVKVTASFGIYTRTGDDTIDDMIRESDAALYAAKDAGRDAIRFAPVPIDGDKSLDPRYR